MKSLLSSCVIARKRFLFPWRSRTFLDCFTAFAMTVLIFIATPTHANCEGNFINIISDICWDCFFPISIGSMKVVSSDYPDTDNPGLPIELCITDNLPRVGLNIGFWEPFATVDVTPVPYCMVNLGGIKLDIGKAGSGGKKIHDAADSEGFYYVHWYKYPLMVWLNILVSLGCMQTGDFDLAYLTELDPTWNDDELGFILNPEAILFGNPIAQAACAADSIKAQTGLPIDKLFWCMGTQGSSYPLTGRVRDTKGSIQAAVLLAERMDFKLHRQLIIEDSSPDSSSGIDGPICRQHFTPVMPKSRYRYQMVNTVAAADKCYQFGHDVITWEAGHNKPNSGDCFGFLIWKKRNCTFL